MGSVVESGNAKKALEKDKDGQTLVPTSFGRFNIKTKDDQHGKSKPKEQI